MGLLPRENINELQVIAENAGKKACSCEVVGCCCTSASEGGSCGNMDLECEGGCTSNSLCAEGANC